MTDRPDVLRTIGMLLPCQLLPFELSRIGRELAETVDEIENEEASQKALRDGMKERLSRLAAKQRTLAQTLRRGFEERTVEVSEIRDGETVRQIRTDTNEEIGRRPLTEDERQMVLTPEVAAAAEGAMVEHGETH